MLSEFKVVQRFIFCVFSVQIVLIFMQNKLCDLDLGETHRLNVIHIIVKLFKKSMHKLQIYRPGMNFGGTELQQTI